MDRSTPPIKWQSSSPDVFICYRRNDSSGESGRLADRLVNHYGEDRVFFDIHTINAGANYERMLEKARQSTKVMIAVIGRDWASPNENAIRLNSDADPVRIEIQSAIKRGIPVVPVLVRGAEPLQTDQLPTEINDLAKIQAHKIAHDTFDRDFDSLRAELDKILVLGDVNLPSATEPVGAEHLIVGGTIPPQRGIYVLRQADRFIDTFLGNDYGSLSISGPRQTGKSSLLVKAAMPHRINGRPMAFVDLTMIGIETSFEQFVYALAQGIARELEGELHRDRFTKHPITAFFDFVSSLPNRAVIIIDEIDLIFAHKDSELLADLFTELQAACAMSSSRCICITSGVLIPHCNPVHLLLDSSQRIQLAHFNSLESRWYFERVGMQLSDKDFHEILDFTGGQPYLLAIAAHMICGGMTPTVLFRESTEIDGPFSYHRGWISSVFQESPVIHSEFRRFLKGRLIDETATKALLELGVLKQSHGSVRLAGSFYRSLLQGNTWNFWS